MARIRSLHPGFFRNEYLLSLSPLHRLAFAGLWTEADRDGLLEDRPRQIKWAILPADDCDMDAILSDLAAAGFIRRYTTDGVKYLAVVNFAKHQRPHPKEMPSSCPKPPVAPKSSRKKVLPSPHLGAVEPEKGTVEPRGQGDLGQGDLGQGDLGEKHAGPADAGPPPSPPAVTDVPRKPDPVRAWLITAAEDAGRILGHPYAVAWGKDNNAIKPVLAQLGPEDLTRRWRAFLTDTDEYPQRNRNLTFFASRVNAYAKGVPRNPRKGVARAEDSTDAHRATPVGFLKDPWGDAFPKKGTA